MISANCLKVCIYALIFFCIRPNAVAVFAVLENEIDGQAFSELSEDGICRMTQKLGVVKKIYRLKLVYMPVVCLL